MAQRPDGFQTSHGGTSDGEGGGTPGVLDADPIINGKQYRTLFSIGENARRAAPGDEVLPDDPNTLQGEIAALRAAGANPINHPQYGWIAEDGPAFDSVHDPNYAQNHESGFDRALGVIMPGAIKAGMAWGAGAGFGGLTSGADFLPDAASYAGETGLQSGAAATTTGGLINSVPESYWSATADAAGSGATMLDAAATGAGTLANTAVDTAINAGGLDGALGDTLTNYTAGMGAENMLTGSSAWSWFDPVTKWAKENQLLASTGLNVAGGLIKGAMTPSPQEQAQALADAKVQSELRLAEARRANNNLVGLNVSRLRPNGSRLARPGIINSGAR